MIDHISLRVSDFQRSLTFYKASLEPLGYTLAFSDDKAQYAGFAGPGNTVGHAALERDVTALVERLLAEPVPSQTARFAK